MAKDISCLIQLYPLSIQQVWEGRITAFDGEDYHVIYPEDGYVEIFSQRSMEEIMIKSDRLVKKKVKIANQETANSTTRCDKPIKNEPPGSSEKSDIINSKRIRMKTDMYTPPPSMFARKVKEEEDASQSNRMMSTSSKSAVGKQQQHKAVKSKKSSSIKIITKNSARSIMPRRRIATPKRKTAAQVTTRKSFKEGEHVWVKQGKGSHAAVIVSCGTKTATVRWSTMNNIVCDVEVKDLLPMFDEKEGGACNNRKRERKQTAMYAPPPKPSKKIKLQELPSDTVDTRAKDRKEKMMAKKRIKEEANTSEFVMQMFGTTKVPVGMSPGAGWTLAKCKRRFVYQPINSLWTSPIMKIIFAYPRYAFEFEQLRQQCNEDERQALEMFRGRHQGNIHGKISNLGLLGYKKKEPTPDKVSSSKMQETPSSPEPEDSEESSSDSSEESDEYEDSDEESLDEWGDMTSSEIEEYDSLYDLYMKPAVRVNEEIAASGMILRKKVATAFLLRSKNSVFRQKLHKKIVALEKVGRKDEIYRLLKKMKQFDSSSTSLGDGPSDLLDEILGERNVSGVEVLSASPVLSSSSNLKRDDNEMIAPGSEVEGVCGEDEVLAQSELKQQSSIDTKTAPKDDQEVATALGKSEDNECQGGNMPTSTISITTKIGKYSQTNISARFMSDGSVLPVHEPRVLSDGRYQRPVGRGRNGYSWDDVRGKWMPNEDQPTADTTVPKPSSQSASDDLNEIQPPQPADSKMVSDKRSQTLPSDALDKVSTPKTDLKGSTTDATDDVKPPSKHSLAVVSPTDSKMAAVIDDSQHQKQVIDLLDDGDDDSSNEKPIQEKNKTAKSDLIDLSGSADEPMSNSAQPECIDLSQIDEPVANSNEVIVID